MRARVRGSDVRRVGGLRVPVLAMRIKVMHAKEAECT